MGQSSVEYNPQSNVFYQARSEYNPNIEGRWVFEGYEPHNCKESKTDKETERMFVKKGKFFNSYLYKMFEKNDDTFDYVATTNWSKNIVTNLPDRDNDHINSIINEKGYPKYYHYSKNYLLI